MHHAHANHARIRTTSLNPRFRPTTQMFFFAANRPWYFAENRSSLKNQIKSNQIKSNQIKCQSQINYQSKANQIKSQSKIKEMQSKSNSNQISIKSNHLKCKSNQTKNEILATKSTKESNKSTCDFGAFCGYAFRPVTNCLV